MTISPTDNPEQSFAAAYDRYADAIFRHCYFRLFDRERGKEVMQDAFMKAWVYVSKGNTIKNAQAFLYTSANRLIIDEVRRRKRRTVVSFEDMQEKGFDIGSEEAAEAMKRRVDEQKILAVLDKVEDQYKDVLIMRYIDELSPAEIATILGESANTVSVRIHRGVNQLRSLLP